MRCSRSPPDGLLIMSTSNGCWPVVFSCGPWPLPRPVLRQVWLAVVFPRAWSPQLGLASALVPVDATRRKRAWWQSRRGKSWDYRNPETAVRLGHLRRSGLLGLFVLLLPYLDADLFGSRP